MPQSHQVTKYTPPLVSHLAAAGESRSARSPTRQSRQSEENRQLAICENDAPAKGMARYRLAILTRTYSPHLQFLLEPWTKTRHALARAGTPAHSQRAVMITQRLTGLRRCILFDTILRRPEDGIWSTPVLSVMCAQQKTYLTVVK